MTTASRVADPTMCDRAVRLVEGNGLPLALLEQVLDVSSETVTAIASGMVVPLCPPEREKLELFCAIMGRLEIRFGYESREVRLALDTPLSTLDGGTASVVMTTGIDGLRAVHRAVAEIALPAERWWRIPPRR